MNKIFDKYGILIIILAFVGLVSVSILIMSHVQTHQKDKLESAQCQEEPHQGITPGEALVGGMILRNMGGRR